MWRGLRLQCALCTKGQRQPLSPPQWLFFLPSGAPLWPRPAAHPPCSSSSRRWEWRILIPAALPPVRTGKPSSRRRRPDLLHGLWKPGAPCPCARSAPPRRALRAPSSPPPPCLQPGMEQEPGGASFLPLSEQEQRHYSGLCSLCQGDSSGTLSSARVAELFKASQLPPEALHKVRLHSCPPLTPCTPAARTTPPCTHARLPCIHARRMHDPPCTHAPWISLIHLMGLLGMCFGGGGGCRSGSPQVHLLKHQLSTAADDVTTTPHPRPLIEFPVGLEMSSAIRSDGTRQHPVSCVPWGC